MVPVKGFLQGCLHVLYYSSLYSVIFSHAMDDYVQYCRVDLSALVKSRSVLQIFNTESGARLCEGSKTNRQTNAHNKYEDY